MGGRVPLLRVLGPLEAEFDGMPVDLGGPRQRSVLALLVAAHGAVVSVDRIIDDLWNGEPPPSAINALQAYISNLRRALEPDRAPRSPAQVLVSVAPGYAIHLGQHRVDAWRAEDLLRSSDDLADSEAHDAISAALDLWRGPAYAEFSDAAWAAPEVTRLTELRIAARERLIELSLRTGAAARACALAEALTRDHPLREEGWRLLATSQYVATRQADALTTLRRARDMFATELGIDIDPRLGKLETAILNHNVELPHTTTTTTVSPLPPSGARSTFVGRSAQVEELMRTASHVGAGSPTLAVVSGEAGAGKSALLDRVRDNLLDGGWRIAFGRCPELDGGPPAWAFAEIARSLREHVDPRDHADPLAPMLRDAAQPLSEDATTGRFRLHRAFCEWLSGMTDRPLAIIVDDAHRADLETRRLFASILAESMRASVLIIVAHRTEPSAGLDDLLSVFARHSPTRIDLAGLEEDDAVELLATLAEISSDSSILRRLAQRTDGNPFFISETARLLASEGDDTAMSTVPAGVADVIRHRVARLPKQAGDILRLASVLGRTIDVDVLVRASSQSESDVVDALELGAMYGLLSDDEPGCTRFAHVLGREALYSALPAVRKRTWHHDVATALLDTRSTDVAAIAHHHVLAATPSTGANAAGYAVAAAQQAEGTYSYDVAADLYRQALDCLSLANADPADRIAVVTKLVPALLRTANNRAFGELRPMIADLVARVDDVHLAAGALSSVNVPSAWGHRPYGFRDVATIDLIQSTLTCSELTATERCALLNAYVRETSRSDDEATIPAAEEALALARQLTDIDLLALSLHAVTQAYPADWHWDKTEAARIELTALANEHSLMEYTLITSLLAAEAAMMQSDIDGCARETNQVRALATALHLNNEIARTTMMYAGLAHLSGDLDEAERLYILNADTVGRAGAADAEPIRLLGRASIALSRGTLAELVDPLRASFNAVPSGSGHNKAGVLALALLDAGDHATARKVLRQLPATTHDPLWGLWNGWAALAAARIGDVAACEHFYALILPFGGRVMGASSTLLAGTADRILGLLAESLGRRDDARAHLNAARALTERLGNQVWREQVDDDLARLS